MAQKLDFTLPFNDLTQYVPQNLRNPIIKGLIDNLFNRHMTHDESVPLYGYVGRKPASPDDRTGRVPPLTVERDINAIVPILNFKLGTETHAFTTQDLIKKANVLGVSDADQNWLYTQANNYLPPINIDKFANFYNYFWVAKSVVDVPSLSWNSELLPEYYTIARPKPTDLDKLNAKVATTAQIVRTGTGFEDQNFTITFTSPTTITVEASGPLGQYSTFAGAGRTVVNGQTYGYTLAADPTPTHTVVVGPTVTDTIVFPVKHNTNGQIVDIVTFQIVREPIYSSTDSWDDQQKFVAGDEYYVDTVFLSTTYSVTFTGSAGIKGKLKNIQALNVYQTIDGVQLQAGQRVLVKDNAAVENGIYIVGPQSWVRADDYNGSTIVPGARVWIKSGTVNGGKLFTSGAGNSWSTGVVSDSNTNDWQEGNYWVHSSELSGLGLTRAQVTQAVRPIIEYNSALELNAMVSSSGVPMSGSTGSGSYKQSKTEFNQLPLFNLYRYDGTHADLVSSIFFYVEDMTAEIDLDLQKRVKTTESNADFLFNHGLVDANGDLLFYKLNGELKSIWHAGYDGATYIDQTFVGKKKGSITSLIPTTIAFYPQTWTLTAIDAMTFQATGSVTGTLPNVIQVGVEYEYEQFSVMITNGLIAFQPGETFTFDILAGPTTSPIIFNGPTKGTLTNIVPTSHTQQQIWTLRAISATQFEVSGSKMASVPAPYNIATVGVPYSSDDLAFTIVAGSQPFDIDDAFLVRIGNFETPRYVYRDSDEMIFDLYGGPAADVNKIGAFQVSRPFIHNPYNSARDEVPEGTLYAHFRSIIANQFEDTTADYAFGGAIKNWSEQQTLLASLLMQRESTPISMIDLAQRMYDDGLNAVSDIYKTNIAQYFATYGVVDVDGSVEEDENLDALLDYILSIRSKDQAVRSVLYDSTSGVAGIPITLPQMGVLPLVRPVIEFHNLLGQNLLKHHDGHSSALVYDSADFRRLVLNNQIDLEVEHSDGTKSPAVASTTQIEPTRPYKGTLWIRPNGVESDMFAFDVDFDGDAPTGQVVGTTWYDRLAGPNGVLYIWDGAQWVAQPTHSVLWRPINLADTLNQLMLRVETRLFENINPNIRKVDFTPLLADSTFGSELQRELFLFSANNSLLPLGSDYVSTNPMTWNYSSASVANFAPLVDTSNVALTSVPARWYNILFAHQRSVANVIETARPNREPWKLLNFATFEDWWITLTASQQAAYTPYATPEMVVADSSFVDRGYVRAIKTDFGTTLLSGLQVIDGVMLNEGDRVLLQNEAAPSANGIYIASAGGWTRANVTLDQNIYVTVLDGAALKNTVWALSQGAPNVNVDPVLFKQIRYWSNQLWVDVQAARPSLRLSVDTLRDELLPPYVSPSTLMAGNALTNVLPSGLTSTYLFGEGSPVETVWRSSLEYGYALARALFRHDPLMFLGFCWGFNWVQVDGILYDGYDINTPGHKRFRLHGEQVRSIPRALSGTKNAFSIASATGAAALDITFTYDGYEVVGSNRYQNFTVRNADGLVLGYVREGQTTSITNYGSSLIGIHIDDFGQPFHIGDKFRLTTTDGSGAGQTISFIAETQYKFLGFGQIFTNALREASIDTTDSYAVEAYRGWDVNMGYRAGGLVATDDLNVRTDSDTLSSASYNLVFKKNAIAKDMWVQGLRVTVQTFGSSVPSSDGSLSIPKTDASDWVFKIEGYNPRYLDITYYNLNTSGPFETFNILDQSKTSTVWKHYTETVGTPVTAFLPLEITGLQNVVNFLFGYTAYLDEQGWIFNDVDQPGTNVDAETGRARTWQLEIEKVVNACYQGLAVDQGHIVNPFMDQLWVRQDTGLMSQFIDTSLFDVTGHPGVYDIAGVRFAKDDLLVIRGNQMSRFGTPAPMYSAHVQLDEYEHVFIFDNYVEDSIANGVLYDPFSGARVVTYKFNGRKQATPTFRPEFGGHYLVGHEVRQNLQASTDNITSFYDPNLAFESETTTRHALALLGFNTKEYFDNLDISEKTQFNFWRGLVQSKGTNLSIDAYLNNNRFEDAKIDEYWAYKVAEYGDARQRLYPELRLNVDDTIQQFTQLQFDAQPGQELPNFTQITRFDEDRWFSIDDLDQDTFFKAEVVGNFYLPEAKAGLYTIPFVADKLVATLTPSVETATETAIVGFNVITVSGPGQLTLTRALPAALVYTSTGANTPSHSSSGLVDTFVFQGAGQIKIPDTVVYSNVVFVRASMTMLQLNSTTIQISGLGTAALSVIGYGPATPRYNPVKLINYVDAELVEEIPLWHPATGQHTPTAMESINIISNLNPAKYNFSTQVANNNSYDPLRPWGSNEIGRVWFDTRNLAYLPYYDEAIFPVLGDRLSRWGGLADYATIDVYEWVQSSVPPSEYNALAALQAGNADLDPATKAAGEVALQSSYVRDRQWSIRPIAWSHAAVPLAAAHPAFNFSFDRKLIANNSGNIMALEFGLFSDVGITAGMRIGGWDNNEAGQKPVSEAIVTDQFTKLIMDGSNAFGAQTATVSSAQFSVQLESYEYTNVVGPITFSALPQDTTAAIPVLDADGVVVAYSFSSSIRCTMTENGEVDIVEVATATNTTTAVPSITLVAGTVQTVEFPYFGLRATVTVTVGGSVPYNAVRTAIVSALASKATVRDAVLVTPVVSLSGLATYTLSNDSDDSEYVANDGIGWRAWSVPTQAQLDADARQPNSSWKPYYGDYVSLAASIAQVQEAVADTTNAPTLNNGVAVTRYTSTWSDWSVLENTKIVQTQQSTGSFTYSHSENIDENKVSVYVNGITQLRANYTIDGATLSIASVNAGSIVTIIIRPYEPSAEELAFDPDVEDDLSFQQHYKQDYEYVSLPVRDSEGSITSSLYYFWVKNKSIAAVGKTLSIQAIAQELRDGPANFLTFQHLIGAGTGSDPYRYDAITISGLSYIVGKDDTFKLRFTRNFTLRDDPEQLNLKDVHTEWSLIRPGQRTRIPESLWLKLVDSVAGQDAAGNPVPALRRVLYDERNGATTQFGFGEEQTLAPKDLLVSSITYTIVNTKLINTSVPANSDGTYPPDFIDFLNFDQSDEWFATPEAARQTMTDIWTAAKPAQINEIFFTALDDILANNYELTDIFKTSRLSAYSIKVIAPSPVQPSYE